MLSPRERRLPSNTPEAASVAAIRASKAGGLVVMVIARLIFESRINNYEQNKCCREVILMRAGGSKGSQKLNGRPKIVNFLWLDRKKLKYRYIVLSY